MSVVVTSSTLNSHLRWPRVPEIGTDVWLAPRPCFYSVSEGPFLPRLFPTRTRSPSPLQGYETWGKWKRKLCPQQPQYSQRKRTPKETFSDSRSLLEGENMVKDLESVGTLSSRAKMTRKLGARPFWKLWRRGEIPAMVLTMELDIFVPDSTLALASFFAKGSRVHLWIFPMILHFIILLQLSILFRGISYIVQFMYLSVQHLIDDASFLWRRTKTSRQRLLLLLIKRPWNAKGLGTVQTLRVTFNFFIFSPLLFNAKPRQHSIWYWSSFRGCVANTESRSLLCSSSGLHEWFGGHFPLSGWFVTSISYWNGLAPSHTTWLARDISTHISSTSSKVHCIATVPLVSMPRLFRVRSMNGRQRVWIGILWDILLNVLDVWTFLRSS